MRARGMRATAAVIGAALLSALAGSASAADTIIGGRAEACSVAAKAGKFDPPSMELCTLAISGELLFGNLLAATLVNRGTMFMGNMNWGAALEDFDQAIKADPTIPEAYVNRGGALLGLRRYKEAEAEIDKGLSMMPVEPEKAYGNRALARWSQDNLQGAYEDFKTALALKPDWTWVSEQLSAFTVETKGVTQAVAAKP